MLVGLARLGFYMILTFTALGIASQTYAQDLSHLSQCRPILDTGERLACYDGGVDVTGVVGGKPQNFDGLVTDQEVAVLRDMVASNETNRSGKGFTRSSWEISGCDLYIVGVFFPQSNIPQFKLSV